MPLLYYIHWMWRWRESGTEGNPSIWRSKGWSPVDDEIVGTPTWPSPEPFRIENLDVEDLEYILVENWSSVVWSQTWKKWRGPGMPKLGTRLGGSAQMYYGKVVPHANIASIWSSQIYPDGGITIPDSPCGEGLCQGSCHLTVFSPSNGCFPPPPLPSVRSSSSAQGHGPHLFQHHLSWFPVSAVWCLLSVSIQNRSHSSLAGRSVMQFLDCIMPAGRCWRLKGLW